MKALLQPLSGNQLLLRPSLPEDLEPLFQLAKDPELWAMHNEKDRGERRNFERFFNAGLENPLGMYTIVYTPEDHIIGATRYYNYDPEKSAVRIGYTFIGKTWWGSGHNAEVKALMLNHAFQFVKAVYFDVYEGNLRSQKAVEKLGAVLNNIKDDKYEYILTGTFFK